LEKDNDRPERTKEPSQEHALAAMLPEKSFSPFQIAYQLFKIIGYYWKSPLYGIVPQGLMKGMSLCIG
jgi:hypothetical protein